MGGQAGGRAGLRVEVSGPSARVVVGKRPITAVVLSDLHFPYEDPDAMRLAKQVVAAADPDIIILNGDVVDFYGISYYPTRALRRARFHEEIQEDRRRIERLLSWSGRAVWIYIEGNHENRLRYYMWRRAPELSELELLTIPNILNLPREVIYLAHVDEPRGRDDFAAPQVVLGKLYIMHGDTIRMSGNAVNISRSVFLRLMVPVLIGHWHRVQSYTQTDYEGVTSGAWVTGCLCRPRPHYDTGRIWGQGMAVITVEDGFFQVDLLSFVAKDNVLFTIWRGQRFSVPIHRKGRAEW